MLKDRAEMRTQAGEAQEEYGTKIRNNAIRAQMFINAERKAQEELGRTVNAIAEREKKERNQAFAERVMQDEHLQSLSEGLGMGGGGAKGGAFEKSVEHQHEMIRNLEALGISAGDYADQIDRGKEQEALGLKIVQQSSLEWEHRLDQDKEHLANAEADANEQRVIFAQEQGIFGAVEAARRTQMRVIEERYDIEKRLIIESGELEAHKIQMLNRLEQKRDADRMQVAQTYPTFMEKQLNSLIASNSFAIGQIVGTWTSGIATMIVKGGDLKAAWESTQIALIQGALNTTVQLVAEEAKRLAASEATAVAASSIWEGFALAVGGAFEMVTAAFMSMTATMAEILTAVGEAIMGVLSAIAEALIDTVFGSPWGAAILAGVIGIGIALGALAAVGVFAEGGIVNSPMLGLVGEAGPEAIIPLDRMGRFRGQGAGDSDDDQYRRQAGRTRHVAPYGLGLAGRRSGGLMAQFLKPRVKETFTATGTGTLATVRGTHWLFDLPERLWGEYVLLLFHYAKRKQRL